MSNDCTSWIEIHRDALVSNVAAFRSLVSPDCRLMVVVKSNAYGHGADIAAPALAEYADWLGVNSLDEALELERLELGKPILIMGFTATERLATIVERGFRQVVFRRDVVRELGQAARDSGKAAKVHLKIETGTNRLGVPWFDLAMFSEELQNTPGIEVEGVYTHFANIEDTLDPSFAQQQLQRFRDALEIVKPLELRPGLVHTAASAGVLLYPETHFSMVRVGIGAYGIWPSRETRIAARERGREIVLTPALTWKSRIAQIKNVTVGEYVGYGLTYQAMRTMRLAVVPVGYYEGYDRKLSSSGRALVKGQPVSVVGRVAMNMTMFDVTEVEAEEGDEVVLIGRQGEAEVTAEEIAEKTGTIPYETLSRIHPFIPRVLV
jgi:alanine racemase